MRAMTNGGADRRMGALLGCAFAADAGSADGADFTFVEWLTTVLTGLPETESCEDLTPPSPYVWPDSTIAAAVMAVEILEKVGFSDSALRGNEELEAWSYRATRLMRPFLDDRDNGECFDVARHIRGVVDGDFELQAPMLPWGEMWEKSLSEIVLSAANGGASQIPIDWWHSGSMAKTAIRGRLLRAIGGGERVEAGVELLERRRVAKPRYDAIQFPGEPRLYFGNPMHVASLPDSVDAVVSVGRTTSLALPDTVKVDILLPWLFDYADFPAADDSDRDYWED